MGIRLFFIYYNQRNRARYVMKLQRDNAILKENAVKLESAIQETKNSNRKSTERFSRDIKLSTKMNELVNVLKKT
ncbi:MAG: hypothetical protein CM15mV25_1370 [uncultured marine virus]|nr:MAG: hypothetical protein CM15mV25_1370 [uncultured marine virus]